MSLTDDEFREAYKPLQIPAHFDQHDRLENKVIFSLAVIGEGTVDDVLEELKRREPGVSSAGLSTDINNLLTELFNKGLLNGYDEGGVMHYNLHKITRPNEGAVDPDLLAPGLD